MQTAFNTVSKAGEDRRGWGLRRDIKRSNTDQFLGEFVTPVRLPPHFARIVPNCSFMFGQIKLVPLVLLLLTVLKETTHDLVDLHRSIETWIHRLKGRKCFKRIAST